MFTRIVLQMKPTEVHHLPFCRPTALRGVRAPLRLLLLVLMSFGSLHAQHDTTVTDTTARADSLGAPTSSGGAAVVFGGDTLFQVMTRIGPFAPADRARAISMRLQSVADNPLSHLDSLIVLDHGNTTDIMSGDLVLMTVTGEDALQEGLPRRVLAERYAGMMLRALRAELKETSLQAILLGALFSLLATVVLIVLIKGLNKVFPKLYQAIDAWRGTKIRSLKIQNLELLPADRIADIFMGLAKLARITLIVLFLYIYLPLIFSFFPWTKGLAARLFGYIVTPLDLIWQKFVDYLPSLFMVLVIGLVGYYVIRFVKLIFAEVSRGSLTLPGFEQEWADPTYKIVRFLLIVFVVIVAYPYLPGSNSPAFQGVGIFLTLLISFGSATAISNIVAGVVLTYTSAFRIGDRVKIADTVGDVIDKTLLVTRVRTIKNVDITIPNAMVLGSHIVNYSSSAKDHGLILNTTVTIGYDVPWRTVHDLLISAALATEGVQHDPSPFVLQTGLNDFYPSYELNAYTDTPGIMARTYSKLHQNIQDKFNEAGVEIMSPHYSAMRDGSATAIPSDYLPKDYTPPPFNIARVDSGRRAPTSDQGNGNAGTNG